jgi:hypothetical protein
MSQQVLVKVTVDSLNIRTEPNSHSAIVASHPRGTVLNYVEVVEGENVAGNPLWGLSAQGHFFWLGGTDHPNAIEHAVTVTVDSLNVRVGPSSQAAIVASYPRGTVLNYYSVVQGEPVSGNPFWGHSVQGHYFWLGGTDRVNG